MKPLLSYVPIVLLAFASAPMFAQAGASDVLISEDFESTAVGAIPADFTKMGAIGVADDAAHSGHHSLKIEPALRGPRFISLSADKVAALGGEHWGRLYYKVKLPAPSPVVPEGKKTAAIHATFVAGKAVSPLENDPIEVRLAGLSLNLSGQYSYLYNVQPKKRKEFGARSKTTHEFASGWTMIEWHADSATQTYQFFLNGQEQPEVSVEKGAGNFQGAEIPAVFQTLSIGFTNYQAATGAGFTVWIDDLAIGKKRIGPGAQ